MKLFLLSALVASSVAKEVYADFEKLVSHSQVEYNEVACGEWDDYICCSSEHHCDKLKKGGDKKEAKKRERERKDYCVHKSEKCCGSDIHYNWKAQRKDSSTKKAVEHENKKKKNVKGCDKDEVCVATSLLKHSMSKTETGDHDEDQKYAVKAMIGEKSKTTCMKKDKFEKKGDKLNKKYKKKLSKEKKSADIEFEENVKIMSIQDHHHQCGNFDKKVFKCCSPDENFCAQIGSEDKSKWCVKEEDQCCMDFTYYDADRDIIKLDYDDKDEKTWASNTACSKDHHKKECVYDKHDKKKFHVTTKCVSKKTAKKNKKRGGWSTGKDDDEDDGQSLIDLLTGGGETQQNPFPFF